MPTPPSHPRWKGKARDVSSEGLGGSDGIVLPLDQVGSGIYDVAYTIPVKFGDNDQQFSLQIDTGSSDLWVASRSCSSSSCKQTNGRLYDPSGSRPTGQQFSIPYLQGMAAGPIVWDRVTLGGYSIDNQALSAASDVEDEPLAPTFSGILGLALPLNSIIAQQLPPGTSNAPDGAAWASNLFSITPVSDAPSARFLSLSLARPGSDTVPSLLGIGRHPASLIPDPGKIEYASLVSERAGTLFWKASVRAITVYVDGVAKPIALGNSVSGGAFPTAVLDSGVPLIFTTSAVSNAIYGALGVMPAQDGNYYVPCKTPLNLTITLDNRSETPIHPLDLTAEPQDDNTSQFCIGLIQAADGVLGHENNAIGDMILGVPFLRNTYTVMAYTPPLADGSFPALTGPNAITNTGDPSTEGDNVGDSKPTRVQTDVTPRLGILALTDPTVALAEFTTVRIHNQPLSSSAATPPNTGADGNTKTISVGGKKLSVGVIVLIALGGMVGLCAVLFGLRWLFFRRRYRKARRDDPDIVDLDMKTAYRLARRMSSGALGMVPLSPHSPLSSAGSNRNRLSARAGAGLGEGLTEDQLREMRYASWKRMSGNGGSEDTQRSDRTLLAAVGNEGKGLGGVDEFGVALVPSRKSGLSAGDEDEDEEDLGWGDRDRTLVDSRGPGLGHAKNASDARAESTPLVGGGGLEPPSPDPRQTAFPVSHARTYSGPQSSMSNFSMPMAQESPVALEHPSLEPNENSPTTRSNTGERSRTMSYGETVEGIIASHAGLFPQPHPQFQSHSPSQSRPLQPSANPVIDTSAAERSRTMSYDTEEGIVATHARFFSVADVVGMGGGVSAVTGAPMVASSPLNSSPLASVAEHTGSRKAGGIRLLPVMPSRQESDGTDGGILGLAPPPGPTSMQIATSVPTPIPVQPPMSFADDDNDEVDELGMRSSMAGIGSASRSSRFVRLGGLRLSGDSGLPFNRESLMSVSSVGTVSPSSEGEERGS